MTEDKIPTKLGVTEDGTPIHPGNFVPKIEDEFNGDNAHLIGSIEALIAMNDKGILVPHGIGGHARTMLAAAAIRLAHTPAPEDHMQGIWDEIGTALALLDDTDVSPKARSLIREALESATGCKAPQYLGGSAAPSPQTREIGDDPLHTLVRKFVADQRITCSETVYQSDRVIENAYELIDEAVKIVGYHKSEEE